MGYKSDYFDLGTFISHISPYKKNSIKNPIVPIINPRSEYFSSLSANISFKLRSLTDHSFFSKINIELYGKNLLDDQFYIPSINPTINTKPSVAGRAFYLKFKFNR